MLNEEHIWDFAKCIKNEEELTDLQENVLHLEEFEFKSLNTENDVHLTAQKAILKWNQKQN